MSGFICMNCGTIYPDLAEQCTKCSDTRLSGRTCSCDYRVAEYFAILRRWGVWPSIEPFSTDYLSSFETRFKLVEVGHEHECEAMSDCPLRQELVLLSDMAYQIIEGVKGLSLEDIGLN